MARPSRRRDVHLPPKLLCVATLGLASLAGFGCGPVEYLNQVTRRAATAHAAAEKVDAEKLAPYEYWTSKEYLHKARELAGYARYQVAIEYGRKAEEAALKARAIALEKKGERSAPEPTAPTEPSTPRSEGSKSE
jgi:hypothetical protein